MKAPSQHDIIERAVRCGPEPVIRDWLTVPHSELVGGELVLRFAADHLVFPEGPCIGKPLVLDDFQQAFILSCFDESRHISKGILSVGRRNGKSLVMAVILLAYLVGPLAKKNTLLRSAAMTREQAGLLWRFMDLICKMSPDLEGRFRSIPSSKKIIGLKANVEYQALSRDHKSGHGQSMYVLVLDEAGQIDQSSDQFLEMLFSSLGTYEDARTFIISTQAPSDAAFLSMEIDSAERDQPKHVVSHVYTGVDDDVLNENNWWYANPALAAGYRSLTDVRKMAEEASNLPAKSNGFLNLYCNRRVSLESAWLSAAVWKKNCGEPDWDVFRNKGATLGLDLSKRFDWTCACMAAIDDEGMVHVYPFTFTPLVGIAEREARDKMPYQQWVRDGVMYAVDSETISYEFVCNFLRDRLDQEEIQITSIEFDAWRADEFFAAADRVGFAPYAERNRIRQGFQTMAPMVDQVEAALLEGKLLTGSHPTLNAGASVAVAEADGAGNRKLAKNRALSHQKIDSLIAMLMACYPLLAQKEESFSVEALIA